MQNEEPIDHALQTLETSVERNPNDAQLKKALARLYLDRGIFSPRAQKIYELVLEREPDNLDIHKALSIAYLLQQSLTLSQETRSLSEIDTTALETNIAKLRKLSRQYKNNAELAKALGDLLLFSGQFYEAISSYERALHNGFDDAASMLRGFDLAEPAFQFPNEALAFFANLAYGIKDFDRARKLFNTLIQNGCTDRTVLSHYTRILKRDLSRSGDTPSNSLLMELCRLNLLIGNLEEALEFAKQIRLDKLNEFSFIKKIAKILIDMNDFRQAFDYLSHVPLDDEAKQLLNEITVRLEQLGELDTAVYLLQFINENDLLIKEAKITRERELEIATELELAELYMKNNRPKLALQKYINALKFGPKEYEDITSRVWGVCSTVDDVDVESLRFMGDFFLQKKNYFEAARYLDLVLQRDPGNYETIQQMRRVYDEILQENPDYAELRIKSGDLYMHTGDLESAIEEFELAAQKPEATEKANKKIAKAYLQSGRPEVALEKYRFLPLDKNDAEVLYDLHTLFLNNGRYREALEAARLVCEIDRSYRDIQESMALIEVKVNEQRESIFVDEKMKQLIGDHAIGRYKYVDKIGGGGMGIVYKVYDMKLNTVAAMKVLREGLSSSGKAIDRFFREARIAATLNHRNIVNIYDYNISHTYGQSFISMEFVEGESLRERIERTFSEPHQITLDYIKEMLYYMSQLSDALSTAHRKGIIHRDIKPDNVMVNAEGIVKITDFGIVHIEEATFTPTGALIGTPRYMSPEQVLGKKVDGRSDIYSVGIILYEVLIGSPPFITGDISYQQVNIVPTPPIEIEPIIPPDVNGVVMKCLEKDPANRFQTANELKDELEDVLAKLGGYELRITSHTTKREEEFMLDSDFDLR